MKSQEILDSWKDIADYLGRDIRTCYRWEKELGLPVRRIDDQSSRSKVFAYKSEIDEWFAKKGPEKESSGKIFSRKRRLILLGSGAVVVIVILILALPFFKSRKGRQQAEQFPPAFEEVQSLADLDTDGVLGRETALRRLSTGNDPVKLYRQGRYYLNKRSRDENELAISFFLKALKIDNKSHRAVIGLAQCYVNFVKFGWDADITWLDQAEILAKRCESSEVRTPEYYSTLADIYLLKATRFEADTEAVSFDLVQRGLASFPNHPHLNFLSGKHYYLRFASAGRQDDYERALEFMEKSFWLNPYASYNLEYTELLMLDGSFDEALEICNQLISLDPSKSALFRLGEILYYQGTLAQSKAVFEQLQMPVTLKVQASLYRGMIAAQEGDSGEIGAIEQELEFIESEDNPLKLLRVTSMYFGLGKEDEAYPKLRSFVASQAFRQKPFIFMKYVSLDKNFENYRQESRFQQIMPVDLK